ncbi:hypothetical protein JOE44_003214 [Chryseobacterium sp. PvR013]|uniref:hypothetical protein n=1 Tax=Chryseobacterium sp. PvR013 TaxID=2806595 RepID=UPI001AE17A5D|nr:hypothetical protein [Chryseobacterium sp. PvR013]MBP1166330.1 hypothetical protein [Chryseobacterium sp. PvR013]
MSYPKRLGLHTQYPSMSISDITQQEILAVKDREEDDVLFLNKTELNTVKTLFQIRNANYYRKHIKPIQLSDYSTDIFPKERVFIVGKIFPVINILFNYAGVKDVEQNVNPLVIEIVEGASKVKYFDSAIHHSKYINIDGGKIKILLPKNYVGNNFPQLMYDFLTNKNSVEKYIGGEFPDYETYQLALRNKAIKIQDWKGQDGSWLTKDRAENNDTWRRAYSYIIEHKIPGRLAPFKQIYDFYEGVDWNIKNRFGHEVKWCKGAKGLVKALSNSLEGGNSFLANDVETILNELNLGICDFAITKFHELMYGQYAKTPLKGDAAYTWDKEFIQHEQGVVAPPIYGKTGSSTISRFQNMADKDPFGGWHGAGAQAISWFNDIVPAFDDFTPNAKVTDSQFRIDLPLLMLYLSKHKPKWYGFKGKLHSDGTVNNEIVKIIKPYEK